MIESIRAILYPWYLANVPQYEPPHIQNDLSCTISSLVECEYIAQGEWFERRDFQKLRDEFYDWSFTPYAVTALQRAEKTNWIRSWDYISRKEAIKQLKQWKPIILWINNYYKDNRILKKREKKWWLWHAICAVGYMEVNNKKYFIVRNTRGEEWLNWYFLAENEIVTRLYSFKIRKQ